ncbi:MAG TPA: FmdB family zinc ribbon protein [Actinomycetota bacterium]|nr:FmdB family zinc ribbon protein [Actinomycetota bacterium]
MPTYEYVCRDCGNHVEAVQGIAEPPLTTCTVCGGALRKVFHPAGIVFKGPGFYATDSRKTPADPGAKAKGDGGSPAADGSAPSGDGSGGAGTTAAGSRKETST